MTTGVPRRENGKYMRLSADEIAEIRDLRYGDGWTIPMVAQAFDCGYVTVQRLAPGRPGKVPNDRLREAFLASGCTAADVARAVGWFAGRRECADGSRVKRTLGILPDLSGKGPWVSTRRMIDAETAALMAEAIGVEPWEVMPDEDVA